MGRQKIVKTEIGWREWVSLPQLSVDTIKAKIDTGARTSALHAEDIEIYTRRNRRFVRFTITPMQRSRSNIIRASAPLVEKRHVKSSIGVSTYRPVISTHVKIGEDSFPIEITLVDRDVMGFRMLLGRQALRKRFIVDPAKSFITRKVKKPAKSSKRTKK